MMHRSFGSLTFVYKTTMMLANYFQILHHVLITNWIKCNIEYTREYWLKFGLIRRDPRRGVKMFDVLNYSFTLITQSMIKLKLRVDYVNCELEKIVNPISSYSISTN